MQIHPGRKIFAYLVLSLVTASVALMAYLSPDQPASNEPVSATYTHGDLDVAVAYPDNWTGSGQLSVDVLDPEDHVVAHAAMHTSNSIAKGRWNEALELSRTLTLDDLVWHRLRYQFIYDGDRRPALEGVRSISEILRRPVVRVMAQRSYLSGADAAVRLIVSDPNHQPLPGGSVRIELAGGQNQPRTLFNGKLNARGTTQAQFRFPDGLTGLYSMRYVVDTPIGSTEYQENVLIEDKASILLTTEKPIYQPGQTMHVRALALDRANHQAAADRNLTFEVEDSRGNKVFKKITRTDSYGIASAEFALADEVNFGAYHLRALMDVDRKDNVPRSTAELALQVERYVLPKFKVAVEFANRDAAAHRGYRPGDHVRGTVHANYFFGKPVDGCEVSVKASAMDVAVFDAGSTQGKTDGEGAYHFDIRLPNYFAGRPLTQDAARVLIEATVKDGAGHSETHGEPVTVSQSPLLVTAVPEGGTLIPGLDNQVFVLASYPDGTPAQADLSVHSLGNDNQTVTTDKGGVAIVHLRGGTSLDVDARDHEGNRASASLPITWRSGLDQILLRTPRAVYRSGETIALQALSNRQTGSVYVDVIKDGQTVATRDIDLAGGRGEFNFTATPALAGTLEFNAYLIGRNGQPVADHRLVFVQPADELKIDTTLDATSYKPGGEARLSFHVTNSRGEGVQAALGLQIVDQAVFALAEKQPGFAKVFFYLEQEALKPRYEIHSIGLPEAISTDAPAELAQRDRAARALFAATELVNQHNSESEFGSAVPQGKYAAYAARYQQQLDLQVERLEAVVMPASGAANGSCNPARVFAAAEHAGGGALIDAWGNKLRIDYGPWNRSELVRSAGPDGRFGTSDDLTAKIEDPACPQSGAWGGKIDAQTEHDRGPFNGMAAIAGKVVDQTGAPIPGASVQVIASGARHTVTAGADGSFQLNGLAAGNYTILASRAGFATASRRNLALEARDRAVLSIQLAVAAVTESVMVTAEAMPMMMVNGAVATGARLDLPIENRRALPAPSTPAAQPMMFKKEETPNVKTPGAAQDTHVRSWFPESLYVSPEIVTDGRGRASVTVPIADSITTWRMAMMASTSKGALGSGSSSIKVFQDFFVDLDLPITLTQGDEVTIPVAAYNYTGSRGNVDMQLAAADWFAVPAGPNAGEAAPYERTVDVDSGHVGAAQFTIQAKRIGKFQLKLNAHMLDASKRADIVIREIEVVPNGREQTVAFNGRVDSAVRQAVDFPAASIPEASTVFVRLYPGPLSQVIEGMDSILRMPGGCFEQTSSSTYPNVLALDYMKRTKKATPEIHAKAEGFIANGYQRLLTFEVPGGGFSWFGNAPANKILTSYGLMEFGDMSKVHDIDPKVIARTQEWLAAQQQADGSWKADVSFINEGATNRYNSDTLRIAAYIGWALENTGYQGPAVEKAKRYVEEHLDAAKPDAYTLALIANFAVDYAKDAAFKNQTIERLLDARTTQDDKVWWTAQETNTYSTGQTAAVETTGLAVQALLKAGRGDTVVTKAIDYIASKKDATGAWGSTQATIMALRALLLASEKGHSAAKGAVEVLLNGKVEARLSLTAENDDLLHQFAFKNVAAHAGNTVEIRFTGEGNLAYQVAGRYFLPWAEKSAVEPLSIAVNYDRTHLAQDDVAHATATVKNNLPGAAKMVMVDLGIPPGFELLTEDLETYIEKSANKKSGRLEKFNLTATQAILYFDSIAPRDQISIAYRLRAKYPIRAKTFVSRVYEYYTPEVGALARPIDLEVRKK
jgi:uncharacterized protein YfaS (alpha-2-macroglobulin family)